MLGTQEFVGLGHVTGIRVWAYILGQLGVHTIKYQFFTTSACIRGDSSVDFESFY